MKSSGTMAFVKSIWAIASPSDLPQTILCYCLDRHITRFYLTAPSRYKRQPHVVGKASDLDKPLSGALYDSPFLHA